MADMRSNIIIRKPKIEDAFGIWSLIKNSPPLDLNSKYSYMLFCTHFRDMSVVAIDPEQDNKVVGFVSGYRPHAAGCPFCVAGGCRYVYAWNRAGT